MTHGIRRIEKFRRCIHLHKPVDREYFLSIEYGSESLRKVSNYREIEQIFSPDRILKLSAFNALDTNLILDRYHSPC